MAFGRWDLATGGAAFPIKINGTLALTINNDGSVATAGALGIGGVLTLTGTIAATKAYGAAPAGASIANAFVSTLSGDAGGTTDVRNIQSTLTVSGAFGLANAASFNSTVNLGHSAGTVTTASVITGVINNTGNGAVTTLRANDQRVALLTGSGVVTEATAFYGRVSRTSGTGTATTARAFYADDSGGAYATTAIGFDTASMGGSTLTANFRARNAAGTARWAYLSDGTALSALAAGLRVGSNVAPVAMLDVTGNIAATTTYQSGAPAGSTAGLWKFGALQTAAVVVDTTRSIYVDIGGVVYHLIVST